MTRPTQMPVPIQSTQRGKQKSPRQKSVFSNNEHEAFCQSFSFDKVQSTDCMPGDEDTFEQKNKKPTSKNPNLKREEENQVDFSPLNNCSISTTDQNGTTKRSSMPNINKRYASKQPDLSSASLALRKQLYATSPSMLPSWRRVPIFDRLLIPVVVILSICTRFFALHQPDEVVFDEVHFGKFMAYYIRRTFYFDVHPPLGRLLFAAVGWVAGFDGSFLFNSIGDSYVKNKIPYVLLRSWPAICGAMVPPLAFQSMRNLGFSVQSAFLSSMLIILDNALVTQSQMIMLDASLILFVMLSVYCWTNFSLRARVGPAFGFEWWKWLLLTGATLGLVCGVKMVGLFTVAAIGICVLVDLWYHLDSRNSATIRQFAKQFCARAVALIALPIAMYFLWFYLHFAVLTKTGPGDNFMTPGFQATLSGNKNSGLSEFVHYGSNVTVKHMNTHGFLHSHIDRYPLRYTDGRVSSQGQQVTVYHHADINNLWQILPAKRDLWKEHFSQKFVTSPKKPIIMHNDTVVLFHVMTGSVLFTHDVASPLMPTNQEFTTRQITGKSAQEEAPLSEQDYKMCLFRVDFGRSFSSKKGDERSLKTLGTTFRLVHVVTGVAMYSHTGTLPEWGFGQQEVNGNKNPAHESNNWYVEEVIHRDAANNKTTYSKPDFVNTNVDVSRRPGFLSKFWELQLQMVRQNAKITKAHPYMSQPHEWPLVLRGISYWQKDTGKQIYLLPNAVSYGLVLIAVCVYLVGLLFWAISVRRGVRCVTSRHTRARILTSCGFLFITWATHYFPFFGMGRSLFLHHYLPASVIAYMLVGGVYDIAIASLRVYVTKKDSAKENNMSKKSFGFSLLSWSVTVSLLAIVFGFFYKFMPLTYGQQELSKDEWNSLRLLNGWDFQFTKYKE